MIEKNVVARYSYSDVVTGHVFFTHDKSIIFTLMTDIIILFEYSIFCIVNLFVNIRRLE